MFKCNDCNTFFNEPCVSEMEKDTGYIEQTCPNCGSDYFEEAHECPICGNPTTQNFCQDCYDTVSTGLNELKSKLNADQGDFEDIIANHFCW